METNANKTAAKRSCLNPLAWVRCLYEAGTIKDAERRAEDIMAEIAKHEATVAALKSDLKRLNASTERSALASGWSTAQVEAAKRGEMMTADGRSWKGGE